MTKENEETEITEAQKFLLNHECADLVISKHRKQGDFIYVSDIMEKFIYTRPKESEGATIAQALEMIDCEIHKSTVTGEDSYMYNPDIILMLTKIRNTLKGSDDN